MEDVIKPADRLTRETPQQAHANKMLDEVHSWLHNHQYSNYFSGKGVDGLPEIRFTHGDDTFEMVKEKDNTLTVTRAAGKNLDDAGILCNTVESAALDSKGQLIESSSIRSGYDNGVTYRADHQYYDAETGRLSEDILVHRTSTDLIRDDFQFSKDGTITSRTITDRGGELNTIKSRVREEFNPDGSVKSTTNVPVSLDEDLAGR